VVAGLAVWMLVATLLNFGLRAGLAGYALAEPAMAFTLGMKVAAFNSWRRTEKVLNGRATRARH
jgi:hypothetical protein